VALLPSSDAARDACHLRLLVEIDIPALAEADSILRNLLELRLLELRRGAELDPKSAGAISFAGLFAAVLAVVLSPALDVVAARSGLVLALP